MRASLLVGYLLSKLHVTVFFLLFLFVTLFAVLAEHDVALTYLSVAHAEIKFLNSDCPPPNYWYACSVIVSARAYDYWFSLKCVQCLPSCFYSVTFLHHLFTFIYSQLDRILCPGGYRCYVFVVAVLLNWFFLLVSLCCFSNMPVLCWKIVVQGQHTFAR